MTPGQLPSCDFPVVTCGLLPRLDEPATQSVRELERQLFQADEQRRKARHRQWKFEQAARHQLGLLGEQIPVQILVSQGPSPEAAHILGHVDAWQLVRDDAGRYHLYVKGWAWSQISSVIAVDLFLGEARWLQLDYGDPREDVRQHFGGPEGMEYCGFSECLELPENFRPDRPCAVQVCDLDGRWKRFEARVQEGWAEDADSALPLPAPLGWLREYTRRAGQRARVATLAHQAARAVRARLANAEELFSLVMAIEDGPGDALLAGIESLRGQLYNRWELLLVPLTAQGRETASRWMGRWQGDARISCLEASPRSRAEAMNLAVARASGRYAGLLESGVCLAPDALAWLAVAISEQPRAAWLYADGTIVNTAGEFVGSDYRPDFSELHLWSRFFTAGLSLYRREEILRAGGLRAEFAGAEEYDLALRLARLLPKERIVHVQEALFSWRRQAPSAQARPVSGDAASLRCVEALLSDAGIPGKVSPHPCGEGVQRLEFAPRGTPRVAVVIATRDKASFVRRCIDSLRAATRYPNYHVCVINNESAEPALGEFLDENRNRPGFTRWDYNLPFNHSAMHNEVLASLDAEFALLLNNDVCGFSPGWLEQLVGAIQLDPRIAGVGPLLIYPDRRVQHGGVIIGLGGGAAHAHRDVPSHLPGYQGRLHCLQDLSACTAACLLIRVSAFREVGGFRAEEYPAGFNDVDLWLRLRDAGYRCVYQPAVSAVHYESVSRGAKPEEEEAAARLSRQLAGSGFRDPFYSPHLSMDCERFRDARSPAEARRAQWERLLDRLRERR